MVFTSHSAEETQSLAANLARKYQEKGGIIALTGDLGAGKTTFTQGFAKGLGLTDKIISPTFIIIRQYPLLSDKTFYHIDLYRLDNQPNIQSLGLSEIFTKSNAVTLIEWADRLSPDQLPKASHIYIKKISETEREIQIDD